MTTTTEHLSSRLIALLAPVLPQILIDKVRVTFENADVRYILIDETPHYNVTDFLTILDKVHTRMAWMRLKEEYGTIAQAARGHSFIRGTPTPIVPLKTLAEILWAVGFLTTKKKPIPKKHIKNTRDDKTMCDMQDTEGADATGVTKVKNRESYDQTIGYIRIRMPEECVTSDAVEKEISRGVIKFGIAYSLRERDANYQNDNGFMAFSYNFCNRWEAAMTERIMRHEFYDITSYNSREYLDTTELADRLMFKEFSTDSYASYTELALRLFARMVTIAKLNWPRAYSENHGFIHNIKTRTTKIGVISTTESSFSCDPITSDKASELGLVDPISKLKAELAVCKAELAAARTSTPTTSTTTPGAVPIVYPNAEEMPPPRFGKARSHGVIIGRNLKTGEDLKYASAERAASQCGMTPASFRRSVVNRKRQLAGCHWRSEGLAIWVPPEGFVYDGHFDASSTNMNFIVATKEQGTSGAEPERKIFESITVAARILDLDRRKLTDFVAMKRAYGGYVWNTLDMDQCGTMIEDVAASTRVPNAAEDAGVSLRCAGRVVELELATGKEVVHDSVTRAAAMIGISALTVREQLLDKPRQAFGRVFRSYVSTSRWQPPDNFVFDASKYVKTGGYVKSVDKDGAEKLYESVWEASRILGFHKSAIQQVINTDKVSTQLGLKWKRPEESDFLHMVPCTPPPLEKT